MISWRYFSWWRHQMEIISALLTFWVENSPVTGEFPTQRPATQNFDVFFDLHLNKRSSRQSSRRWFETPSCCKSMVIYLHAYLYIRIYIFYIFFTLIQYRSSVSSPHYEYPHSPTKTHTVDYYNHVYCFVMTIEFVLNFVNKCVQWYALSQRVIVQSGSTACVILNTE